ncbi:MAG TPA: DUF2332 domain-containing protein [Symbiobacteriaceae bacterium]|nr:DUF2332 domain-containing protein [Symbiobacteriaceae bacterium]
MIGLTLARSFQLFSEHQCELSPLYRRLTAGVAADEAILRLAQPGEAGPKPNMLLAAVHYLLLKGLGGELADWYPSVSGRPVPSGDPYPAFRAFCLAHGSAIRRLLETRRVQTNEVARCAILLPAFAQVAAARAGRPLGLVEVGTSAGLLLHFDRYSYTYSNGHRCGATPASQVSLACTLRGESLPPLPAHLPAVAARVGLDLHPVDLSDPDEALWLQALVWPDQPERLERLRAAITVAAGARPTLIAGDALSTLGGALASLPPDAVPVVFHCHTLNQFPEKALQRFHDLLAAESTVRELFHLSAESVRGEAHPYLTLSLYQAGRQMSQRVLARYQAHGKWLEWLNKEE